MAHGISKYYQLPPTHLMYRKATDADRPLTGSFGSRARPTLLKKLVAEGVGTFILVLAGVGAAVFAGHIFGPLGVAIAFGAAVAAITFAIGHISGAHVNPAVTVAVAATKGMDLRGFLGYIIVQLIGATLAAAIIYAIANGQPGGYDLDLGLGANGYGDHSPGGYNITAAAIAEVVLSFAFVLVALFATDKFAHKELAGIPIGMGLAFVHLVGIQIDNMSVNPARSFGPAIIAGGWTIEQLWLFIIMPIVGALIAAVVYRYIGSYAPPKDDTPPAH